MRLDGVARDEQLGADLALGQVAAQEAQDGKLRIAEGLGCAGRRRCLRLNSKAALEAHHQLAEDPCVGATAYRRPRALA